jgi:uncharacterized membrane protein YhfC
MNNQTKRGLWIGAGISLIIIGVMVMLTPNFLLFLKRRYPIAHVITFAGLVGLIVFGIMILVREAQIYIESLPSNQKGSQENADPPDKIKE